MTVLCFFGGGGGGSNTRLFKDAHLHSYVLRQYLVEMCFAVFTDCICSGEYFADLTQNMV